MQYGGWEALGKEAKYFTKESARDLARAKVELNNFLQRTQKAQATYGGLETISDADRAARFASGASDANVPDVVKAAVKSFTGRPDEVAAHFFQIARNDPMLTSTTHREMLKETLKMQFDVAQGARSFVATHFPGKYYVGGLVATGIIAGMRH